MSLGDQCPSGCGRKVGTGKLMCGPCWKEVPKHLQTEVYAAWRALTGREPGTNAPAQRYREARDAAIGSIR